MLFKPSKIIDTGHARAHSSPCRGGVGEAHGDLSTITRPFDDRNATIYRVQSHLPYREAADLFNRYHALDHGGIDAKRLAKTRSPRFRDNHQGLGTTHAGEMECQTSRSRPSPNVLTPAYSSLQARYHGRQNLHVHVTDFRNVLVPFYFNVVCRIFSTFDSSQNLFRTFVEKQWQHSQPIFYTMMSMAAAKLSQKDCRYRARALSYQSQALRSLREDVARADSWNAELMFVILMLGLSTAWHDTADLGTTHLTAMQHAVRQSTLKITDDDPDLLDFFRDALVYWEMVTAFMNQSVPIGGCETQRKIQTDAISSCPRPNALTTTSTKPHPWTSITPSPQKLFTRIVTLIQHARSLRRSDSATLHLTREYPDILPSAEELDREIWTTELPKLHDIDSTGDEKTPAIHHLLLAEAYMFANLYQLYYCFPQLHLERRSLSRVDSAASPSFPAFAVNTPTFCRSDIWPISDDLDEQVTLLGHSIIQRLQQIPTSSGTLCVQPLLLLVASPSLSVSSGSEQGVRQMREFVLNRLTHSSVAYLSEPMHRVQLAVVEVFKMLDQGNGIFWMDVLQSMGLVTIIG